MVFFSEDGWDKSDSLSVADAYTLERGMSSQMLITGGLEDEEVLEPVRFLRSLACFLNLFAVFSISESIGSGVPVRKDLGINN